MRENLRHETGLVVGNNSDVRRELQMRADSNMFSNNRSIEEKSFTNETLYKKTENLIGAADTLSDFYFKVALNYHPYINNLYAGQTPHCINESDVSVYSADYYRGARTPQLFSNWWRSLQNAGSKKTSSLHDALHQSPVLFDDDSYENISRATIAKKYALGHTSLVTNALKVNPEIALPIGRHFEKFHQRIMDMAITVFSQDDPSTSELLEAIKTPAKAKLDTLDKTKLLTPEKKLLRLRPTTLRNFDLDSCLDAVGAILTIQESLGLPLSDQNKPSQEVVDYLSSLDREKHFPTAA